MKGDIITTSNKDNDSENTYDKEKFKIFKRKQPDDVIVDTKIQVNNPKEPLKDNRIYGIDILRILAMYGVVAIHIIRKGEAGIACKKFSVSYYEIYTIDVLVYTSIDLFGLISGFFGYKSSKFSNIIYLWTQTFFYSVIERIIGYFKNKNKKNLIRAFFPIFSIEYWYFSAYFGLYLIIPFLNEGINKLSQQSMKKLVASLILSCSFFYTFCSNIYFSEDSFYLRKGMTVIWLVILYIIGAYIGKYKSKEKRTARGKIIFVIKWIVVYVVCLTIEIFDRFRLLKIGKTSPLTCHMSPLTFYRSIALLMLFPLIKVPIFAKNIIKTLSLLSYSIYIIHNNRGYFKPNYILKKHRWIQSKGSLSFIYLLSVTGLICLISMVIDFARLKLFNALKIREACIWIDNNVIHKIKFEEIFLI